MFDLEESIAEWRRRMLAAGLTAPAPLEELALHLREEIAQQLKSGCGTQRAFESAVQKIGPAESLQKEFQKPPPAGLERILSVGVGIPTALLGGWQVWMVVRESRGLATMPGEEIRLTGMMMVAFTLALLLAGSGLVLLFYGGRNHSWLPNEKPKGSHVQA